jgi:hypothetical protein
VGVLLMDLPKESLNYHSRIEAAGAKYRSEGSLIPSFQIIRPLKDAQLWEEGLGTFLFAIF